MFPVHNIILNFVSCNGIMPKTKQIIIIFAKSVNEKYERPRQFFQIPTMTIFPKFRCEYQKNHVFSSKIESSSHF